MSLFRPSSDKNSLVKSRIFSPRFFLRVSAVWLLLALALYWGWSRGLFRSPALRSSEGSAMANSVDFEGTVRAPEFPSGVQWLNTERPLSLAELRGKMVLLDFWTYCCINCMHVLPDLKKLEHKYPNELVVIGVHSAKFTTEKGTDNIRQAILRYQIEHPVINDKDFQVWRQYGARAWPTLVLINPQGRVIGQMSGEGIYEVFDAVIGQAIAYFDQRKLVDRKPVRRRLERQQQPARLLEFPGKVLADAAGRRLFISDSNHNRVIVTDLSGRVQRVIGQGERGFKDGPFDAAQLANPQGLALDGPKLYIADTDNHAIRCADLSTQQVTSLAGTGAQARAFNVSGTGRRVALNSPWDVLVHDGVLYIAMAGSHQIWSLDLKTLAVQPYAGTGREARVDGTLANSAWAQPSGLATDGRRLFVADSETSSIRVADLPPGNKVRTIVGVDLFEYGDKDGKGDGVRLQHALGVSYHEGKLYVADTYNSKIKILDPEARTAKTFLGTGKAGWRDGKDPEFAEPGGLSVADGKLYVADTNNHCIRVVDLADRTVTTLALSGLEAVTPDLASAEQTTITLPALRVAPGQGQIQVAVTLPSGYKLNPDAPSSVKVTSKDPQRVAVASERSRTFTVPATFQAGDTELTLDLLLYYCATSRAAICLLDMAHLRVPVQVTPESSASVLTVPYTVPAKQSP